jgi:hypothetical protein
MHDPDFGAAARELQSVGKEGLEFSLSTAERGIGVMAMVAGWEHIDPLLGLVDDWPGAERMCGAARRKIALRGVRFDFEPPRLKALTLYGDELPEAPARAAIPAAGRGMRIGADGRQAEAIYFDMRRHGPAALGEAVRAAGRSCGAPAELCDTGASHAVAMAARSWVQFVGVQLGEYRLKIDTIPVRRNAGSCLAAIDTALAQRAKSLARHLGSVGYVGLSAVPDRPLSVRLYSRPQRPSDVELTIRRFAA